MDRKDVMPILMQALMALSDDGHIDTKEGLQIISATVDAAGIGFGDGSVDLDVTEGGSLMLKTEYVDITIKPKLLEKIKI